MNETGLFLDIACCGSDYSGALNNPYASDMQIIKITDDNTFNCIKEINHIIKPDEKYTISAWLSTHISKERVESGISLVDYLTKTYNNLTKCNNAGMYLIGFCHIQYDLEILNRHFVKILNKEPIVWNKNKIIDIHKLSKLLFDWRILGNYTVNACYCYAYANLTGSDSYELPLIQFSSSDPTAENNKAMKILEYTFKTEGFKSFKDCVEFINTPREYTEFDFGKYKGVSFEEVFKNDRSYIIWLSSHTDDENLKLTIKNKMKEEEEVVNG